MGDGFWLFAPDATTYFAQAVQAAGNGPAEILLLDRGISAVTYVQLLAGTVWLLGGAVALGVLINLFCYLGSVAILESWGRRQPGASTATTLAIVAISVSPGLLLWSLQPLKD